MFVNKGDAITFYMKLNTNHSIDIHKMLTTKKMLTVDHYYDISSYSSDRTDGEGDVLVLSALLNIDGDMALFFKLNYLTEF